MDRGQPHNFERKIAIGSKTHRKKGSSPETKQQGRKRNIAFRDAIYFYLFYFICHTIIPKNIGKEENKKWRGDLTETIGAYKRLGLLEL